ncbi:hypothetical protein [Mangrovihabitans endophyticus]|uniref:Uncharacterized protein n=1 Tax=Mangrovihabitans endophyticus TaxID=1751298 RepID=A0A8J3FR73_9ACTN|nr:hypothetical protein [Mangrovihabitans endophyticus]GGL04068.1 hypothetical protein GCM10012284_43450 [Mangrovihabitans endophyticus]
MPWRNWSDDDELLRDIGDAARPGPHEQQVIDAGRAVFAFHGAALDRDLAALLYDSRLDGLAAVRGPVSGAPRSLVFGLGDLRVEVELSDEGIEGQLIPPGPGTVRLLDATGPVAETSADDVGCFALPQRDGPIRIECVVDGRRLATEWIAA